jgi:hypothetical protein
LKNITNFYTFALLEQMANQLSTEFFKATEKEAGRRIKIDFSSLDVLIIFLE